MNQDQIEQYIEILIETKLKPELRKRIEYIFRDFPEIESDGKYHTQAKIYHNFVKPLIVFYTAMTESMIVQEKYSEKDAKDYIKRIISHELTHLFTTDENVANSKQRNNKYLVDEKEMVK